MKINIIYHTKFGNNEKIADFLADQFNFDVSVYSTKKHHPKNITEGSLYIVCSPTHIANAPFKIRRFVKRLKTQGDAKYALIITYAAPNYKTAKTLTAILSKKAKKIGELKIKTMGMKGPLEDGWKEKIKRFAKDLILIK